MDAPGVEDQERSRRSRRTAGSAEPRGGAATETSSLASLRENVSEVIRILRLRRWFFLIPFCLGTVLATTASHYLPRTYTASTTFERVDDEALSNLPALGQESLYVPFRETLRRDVRSPQVMNDVVDEIGLAEDLPRNPDGTLTSEGEKERQRISRRLAARVAVGLVKSTDIKDVVQLIYTGPDPNIGVPLLTAIRDAYMHHTRARITQKLCEDKTFFETESAKRREILDELEYESLLREVENPFVNLTSPNVIFIKQTSLDNEQRELQRRQETCRAKLLKTRQYIESIVTTASMLPNQGVDIGLGPALTSPRARQIGVEIDRINGEIDNLKIRRQMTDRHPEIVALRELRQRYERLLADQQGPFSVIPNQGLAVRPAAPGEAMGEVWQAQKLRAEMDVVAYEDELERTAASLQRVEDDILALEKAHQNIPQARRQYRKLREETSQARSNYGLYATAARQYALLLETDESERGIRFEKLGAAVAWTKPTSPKSKTMLALALVIGIGAGLVSVLLAELLDRSFHTSKQVVQTLGLNILETIDEIITSADRARRFRRRFILAPVATVVLLGAVGLSTSMAYLSLERPTTYRRLMQKPRNLWQHWTTPPREEADHRNELAASVPRDPTATRAPG